MNYEIAKKGFETYLNNYNQNDGSIKLKIIHTYEVVSRSEYLAKELSLSNEDICLAKIIALLHDIGRFEQVKVFKEFSDKKIDHAEYGTKVLFQKNLIRKFVISSKYDEIINKVIYNHNKLKIENGLDKRTLLHSKIIRDADKLDNFRVNNSDKLADIFPDVYNENTIDYETISSKVYNDFLDNKCILLSDRKTFIDYWLCAIAFIFDLNFKSSLKYIKENNYVNKLINRLEYKNETTQKQMKIIRASAQKYIADRI